MTAHIRLTKSFARLEEFFSGLQCESLVVYEHTGARVHVHAYMKGGPNTTTMKARLVKLCGAWNKEDWAFMTKFKPVGSEKSEPVNENLLTYLSKGTINPSMVVGFTPEEIEAKRLLWVAYEKPKKPTYADIVDEVLLAHPNGVHREDASIIHTILQILAKHRMVAGRYKTRDIYDAVLARRDAPAYVARLMHMFSFPIQKI